MTETEGEANGAVDARGRVSEFEGSVDCITSGHVVATNGHIHDALLEELARVTPLSIVPATK